MTGMLKTKKKEWLVYGISFLLPIAVLLVCLLKNDMYPAGDNTIFSSDLNGQYSAYLAYFKSVLSGQNNLLYTFSKTLGGNYYGFAAYYLFSPFNLLLFFADLNNLPIVVCIIILLKVGSCGLTMSIYLSSKKSHWLSIAFSLAYALMGYVVNYLYNIMWLDCVILLPLVCLGIEKLMDKNEIPYMYIGGLTVSIISNYYIGYMICIFAVIYFTMILYAHKDKKDRIFRQIRRFLTYSAIAGGLAAMVWLPSAISLLGGKTELNTVAASVDKVYNWNNLLHHMMPCANETGSPDAPYIYCGVISVIFAIGFFLNKRIVGRQRLGRFIAIVILLCATNISFLNVAFHAFAQPAGFPWRYSFLISFLIVGCAWEQVIYYLEKERAKYWFIQTALCIIIMVECFINTNDAIVHTGQEGYKKMSEYTADVEKVQGALASIPVDDEKRFARTEKTYSIKLNDSMRFNYMGVSHFSSTDALNITKLMKQLGYATYIGTGNWSGYTGNSTMVADSFWGIRYLLADETPNSWYRKVADGVYENPYALPLTIVTNKKAICSVEEQENVFQFQNAVYGAICANDSLLKKVEFKEINASENDGQYEISFVLENEYENDLLYLYLENAVVPDNIEIYVGDEDAGAYMTQFQNGTFYLGEFEKGQNVEIRLLMEHDLDLEQIQVYRLNKNSFDMVHEEILSKQLSVVWKESSSQLYAEVHIEPSEGEKTLLFTIPNDSGWTVTIDGKKQDTYPVLNALMGVDITEGTHKVALSFWPRGLREGIVLSLCSFFLLFLISVFKRKQVLQGEQ